MSDVKANPVGLPVASKPVELARPPKAAQREGSPSPTPPPKAARSKVGVGLDMSMEDVIELDSKGFALQFSSEVGAFRELDEETERALGYENRVNYGVARGMWLALKKDVGRPEGRLEIMPPLAASAGRRLDVDGQEPGWHYCWKRPDELSQAGMAGYSLVQGGSEKTFAEKGDGTHKVGAFGQTELVLMKIPQEKFEAIEKAAGAKSRALIETQTNDAEESIRKSGGVPFRPKENDGISWREGKEG